MTLSQTQLSILRKKLDQLHHSLLEQVRDAREKSEDQQYVEIIGRVPADVADEASGDALADIKVALIDRQMKEIRDIEAAMARIQEGNYAACVDCGDMIAYARLLAYPTATRCAACQERHERLYAGEATHKL